MFVCLLRYFIHDEDRYTKFWYTWWHGKLAGFFESHNDLDRRSEVKCKQMLNRSKKFICSVFAWRWIFLIQ